MSVRVPGEGVVVVWLGDDVAVGVEGDCLAGVAGVLGDFGWCHASFEGEADPAVAEVVGGVAGCAGLVAGFADRPSECAVGEVGEQAPLRGVVPGRAGGVDLLGECWGEVCPASGGVGFAVRDPDPGVGGVEVGPGEGGEFADADPCCFEGVEGQDQLFGQAVADRIDVGAWGGC